jgi:hypothetical protein
MNIGLGISIVGEQAVFSPSALLAGSTAMVWLDPSDLTTLFQDTAGTTPVTTAGQSVALVLDKSQGLALGPELRGSGAVANLGAPSVATTYNTTTGVGRVRRDDASNAGGVSITTSATGYYLIDIEVPSSSSGSIRLRVDNAVGGTVDNTPAFIVPGTRSQFRVRITASGTAKTAFFVSNTANAETSDFIIHSVRELPGFHATQATAASRPTYGVVPATGRRNLLEQTETFSDAYWRQIGTTSISANTTTAPNGTLTADTMSGATGNPATTSTNTLERIVNVSPSTTYTFSCYVSGAGSTTIRATLRDAGSGITPSTDQALSGSFVRISVSLTTGAATTQINVRLGNTNGNVVIWGAQLETGSTATAYQRVTDQYNVTEAGVQSLSYLSFDGVDDFLVTPTITPNIDKAQVFAGVRKLSDANFPIIAEFSPSNDFNNGSFALIASGAVSNSAGWSTNVRGSAFAQAQVGSGYPSPTTKVVTSLLNISGDNATLRVNGTQAAQSTADQGTGNFLAYPLYIGRRGGTSLPFNGQLYSLIIRFGASLDAGTISGTERWVGSRTGVTIA